LVKKKEYLNIEDNDYLITWLPFLNFLFKKFLNNNQLIKLITFLNEWNLFYFNSYWMLTYNLNINLSVFYEFFTIHYFAVMTDFNRQSLLYKNKKNVHFFKFYHNKYDVLCFL
jgi:hypothetical protein